MSISGKGRAKTFAVAAHVTAARIQDAPVDVIGHGHLRVAFFKQIRFENVAVSDCPHFAMRMSGASVLQRMIGQLENG